jgi:prefoldin subunit 5
MIKPSETIYNRLEEALKTNVEMSKQMEEAIDFTEKYLNNLKEELETAVNDIHTRVTRIEDYLDRRLDAKYAIRSEFV